MRPTHIHCMEVLAVCDISRLPAGYAVFSCMMLSLSEIRRRAVEFSQKWQDETSEDAEAKSFWDGFFTVFGIDRRRVASFEHQVKKAGEKQGFIDLFWPGVCLVEHKSRGRDLDRAFTQALDYFPGIADTELPRYVIVSDFERIRLHDLVDKTETEFTLADLPEKTHLFGFISGYVQRKFRDEDPANIKAAELMGKLHDALKANGYEGHALEVFLVRILFCLFADDTGIFERDTFASFLETKTREDGLGFGSQIIELFQILNTPVDKRSKALDDEIASFPYVNGQLFAEPLPVPTFDSATRKRLLDCAYFNWQNVSPAVFGAMFQSVMDPAERRNLGAHYTSEKNILKVVSGLFLDELRQELKASTNNASKLKNLHERIANMRFLDPACGCGNFLIVTYKELRILEIDILKRLEVLGKRSGKDQMISDVSLLSRLSVHAMNGIEIKEFPSRIAETALWLVDHQMNVRMAEEFGSWFVRLPLTEGPTIHNTDALEYDWKLIIDAEPEKEWFVLGNPPFIGSKMMTDAQRAQIKALFGNMSGSGVLDYVTGWYVKAATLIQGTSITCAFVSTNSISQGEQVGLLWKHLVQKYGIKIHFAHRTFRWSNEARGVAAVHCVIIGFGLVEKSPTYLYDYETITSEPTKAAAKGINGYLTEGADVFILKRKEPVCNVPHMLFGSMPNDDGNLLLTSSERENLVTRFPSLSVFIRQIVGAEEFINSIDRFTLWFKGIAPAQLRQLPKEVFERVERVKLKRAGSSREATKKLAATPWLWGEIRQPDSEYLLIPSVSSENRQYIPIGFMKPDVISTNLNLIIPNARPYHFGILTSSMHMAWVRYVCGRLKSDYRYSKDLVYNNYPWPNPTDQQTTNIEKLVQAVLDARAKYPESSLADLYHPLTMPVDLRKAHDALDKAVDALYWKAPFNNERERVEHLFGLYRSLTEGFGAEVPKKKAVRKQK